MSATAEQKWKAKVARVTCRLCARQGTDDSPAEVHHMKYGSGACNETSDFLTIALCVPHHRVEYPESVHALKEHGLYLRYKCSELDLLADTIAAVARLR